MVILFALYLFVCTCLVARSRTYRSKGLSSVTLIVVFLIKVAVGVLYGYIYSAHADSSDSWQIYQSSLEEYNGLLQDPVARLHVWAQDLVPKESERIIDFFGTDGSFWNYLKDRVIIYVETAFNFLSGGHYYVNVVFYAFLTFGGYMAFYRALLILLPGSRVTSLLSVFFVPSALFWTSGMYKDGVLFMLLGYAFNYWVRLWTTRNLQALRISKLIVCLIFIFILRNYLLLVMLPAFVIWWIVERHPSRAWQYSACTIVLFVVSFFGMHYLSSGLDFPALLANRRSEFLALDANTKLTSAPLIPTFSGYVRALPNALNHAFLRPYLWENKGWFYLPFAVELVCFYAAFLFYISRNKKDIQQGSYFIFACVFLAANWLLLGYTAPITGALIRYKSLFLPFVVPWLMYSLVPRLNTLRI